MSHLSPQRRCALYVSLVLVMSVAQIGYTEPVQRDQEGVTLSGELFTHLRVIDTGAQRLSSFELSRAEVGAQSAEAARWAWELRLESLRSAGEASLIGVDGDSLVMRVKRAWGAYRLEGESWSLVTRVGLIPDLWHLRVMSAFPLRSVGPSQGEREGLQEASDLGASWTLSAHKQALFMSVTNGEGRRYTEQNTGKDLLFGVQLSAPLFAHRGYLSFAYRDGSLGPASGRNHRLYSLLSWRGARVNLGGAGTYAWGYRSRPSREVLGLQAWALGWLSPERLGLFGLAERLTTQGQPPQRSADRWIAGLSHRLYQRQGPDEARSSALTVTLLESLEHQAGSELNSPVLGQATLAEQWRAMVTLNVAWGPQPLHAQVLGDTPPF